MGKICCLKRIDRTESTMDKKVVIIVQPGFPYRKTVLYGIERAKEIGANLLLLGVIHEFSGPEGAALAIYEFSPYGTISKKIEEESIEFLDMVIQFCRDNGVTAEIHVDSGGSIENIVKRIAEDPSIRLIIVPTPAKNTTHSVSLNPFWKFVHNMVNRELRCPVISVLAT